METRFTVVVVAVAAMAAPGCASRLSQEWGVPLDYVAAACEGTQCTVDLEVGFPELPPGEPPQDCHGDLTVYIHDSSMTSHLDLETMSHEVAVELGDVEVPVSFPFAPDSEAVGTVRWYVTAEARCDASSDTPLCFGLTEDEPGEFQAFHSDEWEDCIDPDEGGEPG